MFFFGTSGAPCKEEKCTVAKAQDDVNKTVTRRNMRRRIHCDSGRDATRHLRQSSSTSAMHLLECSVIFFFSDFYKSNPMASNASNLSCTACRWEFSASGETFLIVAFFPGFFFIMLQVSNF